MTNLLVKNWLRRLIKCGVPEPKLSLKYFLEDSLSISLSNVDMPKGTENIILTPNQASQIEKFVFRREQHEPIQYILGKWPFRDLQLKMKSPVFIPRPETEGFVDIIKDYLNGNTKKALEIGVGSGAISLSLIKETALEMFGIDKSKDAVELTLLNAQLNGLESKQLNISQIGLSDDKRKNCDRITQFMQSKCNIIISNPPYIPYNQLFSLERQVQWYESIDALNGGHDGLHVIKQILNTAADIMEDNGLIFLELDESHPAIFVNLLNENLHWKLQLVQICNDVFNKPRFVILRYKP